MQSGETAMLESDEAAQGETCRPKRDAAATIEDNQKGVSCVKVIFGYLCFWLYGWLHV